MNKFEASRFGEEPGNFMSQIQALAAAAPGRPGPADAGQPLTTGMAEKTGPPSVEELCARYENENAHTEQVTRLALQLFDATHDWLGVTGEDRALLEAAGRLHDVAYHVDPVHHLERSAEIVWREGLEGFSSDQCACIAAVILFHAGKWKKQLEHPLLKRLRAPNKTVAAGFSSDRSRESKSDLRGKDAPVKGAATGESVLSGALSEPQRAMQLGAFLRVADGLDWGHVQDAAVVGTKKFRKLVRVRVSSDWFPANLARADQKADLWREVFPLDIRFVRAKSRRPRPLVGPEVHALEAARRLLSVQYKTILANVDGAVAGDDPEHLHRVRVAIRRLRSLLRAFRKYLPDTGPIDEALGLFGRALGAARDLDVWVAFLHSDEITRVLRGNRRWRAFVQHHEQVHRLQRPTVRRELRGARFHAVRRRMAKLLRAQLPLLLCAGPALPLEEFATKKFLKELRQVRDLGALRHSPSPAKLHRLRVALRRARYLGEFFGPLLGKSAGRLTRRLHQLEKPLAQIHDLDVGLSLIQHSGPASPRVFADRLHARREQQRCLVERAWRRLVVLEKKTRRERQAKPIQTKPRRQV